MDSNRRMATVTRAQLFHERVMLAVVMRLQDTPYVFKGGSALRFAYGLDRHSTDFDFDSPSRFYIKDRIKAGLSDSGVTLRRFIVSKDSPFGQRFKVHYSKSRDSKDLLMIVDLSFRRPTCEDDAVTVKGIRTYRIDDLFDQKLAAAHSRTRARDLYDLAFIAKQYGNQLSHDQIKHAESFSRDYEDLAYTYDQAFQEDKLLKHVTTAEDRALEFRIAIEEQLIQRESRIEQRVPGQTSFAQELALHKMWLDSGGKTGSRADFSDRNLSGQVLIGVNLERAILARVNFSDADFRNANLRESVMHGAILHNADLRGTDVTGADVTHISMRKTLLGRSTKGIGEALTKAIANTRGRQVVTQRNPSVSSRGRERKPTRSR